MLRLLRLIRSRLARKQDTGRKYTLGIKSFGTEPVELQQVYRRPAAWQITLENVDIHFIGWTEEMRVTGVLRILAILFTLFTTWFFANAYFNRTNVKSINLRSWLNYKVKTTKAPLVQNKCNTKRPCPSHTFSFKLISGAANVVGPSMCFENTIIMSGVKNNIGRGLNIALINGTNGQLIKTSSFDMYSGDVKNLLDFLKGIVNGMIVSIASYDDPATKLNDEARKLLDDLGSSYASKLGFRDNWVFLGAKGLKNKSPFEQFLKNDNEVNKYDGWPEVLELEGCVPKKIKS